MSPIETRCDWIVSRLASAGVQQIELNEANLQILLYSLLTQIFKNCSIVRRLCDVKGPEADS